MEFVIPVLAAVFGVLLGMLLPVPRRKTTGEMLLHTNEEGLTTFTLDLSGDPMALAERDVISFKVVRLDD